MGKRRGFILSAVAASAALVSNAVWADVVIEDVKWQVAVQTKKRRGPYQDIGQWLFPPPPTVKARPRIVVKLLNSTTRPETAVLLRYVFYARLRRIGREEAGTWGVPIVVEERHIPRVRAESSQAVAINLNRVALAAYLKRMHHAGFWPDAFRATVMVEPRPGETMELRVMEKALPLQWKTGEVMK